MSTMQTTDEDRVHLPGVPEGQLLLPPLFPEEDEPRDFLGAVAATAAETQDT